MEYARGSRRRKRFRESFGRLRGLGFWVGARFAGRFLAGLRVLLEFEVDVVEAGGAVEFDFAGPAVGGVAAAEGDVEGVEEAEVDVGLEEFAGGAGRRSTGTCGRCRGGTGEKDHFGVRCCAGR